MAVVTAAVVGAVATAATTGYSMYQQSQTPATGANPKYTQAPMNPQDKAMKDYFDRVTVANANKNYPSFAGFLESGGDPAKAQFPMTMPDLTPNEASALGFVGGKGEPIPGVSQASVSGTPGTPQTTSLSTDQMMYMAKERARQAAMSGQQPGPWAGNVMQKQRTLNQLQKQITNLQGRAATPGLPDPRVSRINNRISNLTTRQSTVQSRLNALLQPGGGGAQ